MRIAPALLALALSACAAPQTGGERISLTTLQDVTRTLSSDEFDGRAPGTLGEELTIAYLSAQFEAAGLQPGNNGSWLQPVPLVEITAQDVAPLAIGDLRFASGSDWVGMSYRETASTTLANSEVVFVGYGINAPERGWNDYAGIDMRGKTALILVNDPDNASEELTGTFNGRAMTYYGRWTYKFEEAARQGAAAALIVHEDFAAAYGWSTVQNSWSGPQVRASSADGGASQTLVNGWVQQGVAAQITAAAGKDLAALSVAARTPGFRAVPLGIIASASFTNAIRRFETNNVIGVLPGAERPDEYILNTAHWDHLGRCTPNAAGDDICNGAVDNAAGTAALVALARAHHEAGPTARSQIFLAVTAEESGLLGSEYYGANPVFPLAQTAGGLNMDALQIYGEARDVVVIGGGKSELDDYLLAALAPQGRTTTPDPSPQAGRYYRSDHFSLAKRGVPMLYIKSGEDLLEGGTAAGHAAYLDYNANRYHGPDDEYDSAWNWDGMMRDLDLFFTIGRSLGDTDQWPNWLEGDEFRATRDAMCAPEGAC